METGMGGRMNDDVTSRGSSGWRHRRSVHPARCIWSASVQWRHCIIFFSLPQMFTSFFRQFDIQKYHQWNVVFQLSFPIFLLVKCYAKKRGSMNFISFVLVISNFLKFVKYYYLLSHLCEDIYAMGKIFITRVYGDIQGLKHFLRSCEMRSWSVISSTFYISEWLIYKSISNTVRPLLRLLSLPCSTLNSSTLVLDRLVPHFS